MLIVPLQKPINRRTFPVVTAGLVLVNLFVFFGLQSGDADVHRRAVDQYVDSGLMEIEWPRFKQFVEIRDPAAFRKARRLDQQAKEPLAPEWLVARAKLGMMERHAAFQRALEAGRIVEPADPIHEEWRAKRDRYAEILDEAFTYRHLLSYDEPAASAFLTHQFLHGSALHLIGNMVFLVALGLLVEGALGGRLFLAAYLVCGVAAGGASLLVHWGQPGGGLVGASGAIAGLMGLFTVLYNWRPVRFLLGVRLLRLRAQARHRPAARVAGLGSDSVHGGRIRHGGLRGPYRRSALRRAAGRPSAGAEAGAARFPRRGRAARDRSGRGEKGPGGTGKPGGDFRQAPP